MSVQRELQAHYAAVRERLNGGPKPRRLHRIIYDQPIGPARPSAARRLYESPIGPSPLKATVVQRYDHPIGPVKLSAQHIMLMPVAPWTTLARKIVAEVAELYGVDPAFIMSDSRRVELTRPRHHVMWRLKNETPWAWTAIGRFMGRDHSTIVKGYQAHQRRLDAGMVPS